MKGHDEEQRQPPLIVRIMTWTIAWIDEHRVLVSAFLAYVAVVLVGFIFTTLFNPGERTEFVARRLLQHNHRIVADDIAEAGLGRRFLVWSMTTRDDFYGRYVEKCVTLDDAIGLDDTLSGPQLGESVVWLPLSEQPAADVVSLDVGDNVEVCNLQKDEMCGQKPFPVVAVACPDKSSVSPACSAGVVMGAADRKLLLTARDHQAPASTSTPAPAPAPAPPTRHTPADAPKKHKQKPGKPAKNRSEAQSGAGSQDARTTEPTADSAGEPTPSIHLMIHRVKRDQSTSGGAHATPAPCPPVHASTPPTAGPH